MSWEKVDFITCEICGGKGYDVRPGCCGRTLPSGECCGVPIPEQVRCECCGGNGGFFEEQTKIQNGSDD